MIRDIKLDREQSLELARKATQEEFEAWLCFRGVDPKHVCGKTVNMDGTITLQVRVPTPHLVERHVAPGRGPVRYLS